MIELMKLKKMNGCCNEWPKALENERMIKLAIGWMDDEWINEQKSESTIEWIKRQMNDWLGKRMNGRMNKRTDEWSEE